MVSTQNPMSQSLESDVEARTATISKSRDNERGSSVHSSKTPQLTKIRQSLGGDIAIFLVAFGAGVTIASALHDASYVEAHSLNGLIVLFSRFSALIGTYLVLVSLLMIARIPWVEHSVGYDRLVAYHRQLGPVTLSLIALHVVLIVIGYARSDGKSIIGELNTLVFVYAWMIPAALAFIIMAVIAFSSANRVRRKLAYETWWNLHILSYLAIALAFMHQIMTGSLFIFNEFAKIWWIALYIYTAFAMVAWRFVLPVVRSFRHRLFVDHVDQESNNVVSVYICGRKLDAIHAHGGNFFEWRFLTKGIWSQAHPYSLSAPPTENMMRITVKNLGDHSWALSKLTPGIRVVAEGPYGTLTAARAIGSKVLLVGGGVGITPLRALMEDFPINAEIDLIYRVIHEDELVLKSELDALDISERIRVHYLVGPPEMFPLSPEDLLKLIPHIAECDVFVCGPPGLAKIVRHSVESLGVKSSKFHNEAFAFHAG